MEVGLDLMELFENITAVEDLRHHVPGNSVWRARAHSFRITQVMPGAEPRRFPQRNFWLEHEIYRPDALHVIQPMVCPLQL